MSMDVEQLHVVLQQSFSPDSNLRVPAEATIRNLKHTKGSTVLLLQIAAEKQVSIFVSLAKPFGKKTVAQGRELIVALVRTRFLEVLEENSEWAQDIELERPKELSCRVSYMNPEKY